MDRVIGKYKGREAGPLVILIGAMHGNEGAGVKAISKLLGMLEDEPSKNPSFEFKGSVLGLIGNLKAFKRGKRFVERDLNRSWNAERIQCLLADPNLKCNEEEKEILAILQQISMEIKDVQPTEIFLIDIHTTTAFGGIFSIPSEKEASLNLAIGLKAPVITKMIDGIQGTSLHYFRSENMGIPTTSVVFEAGQHEEEKSVDRAIAAIVSALREVGCVRPTDVENKHEDILLTYSKGLPPVSELLEIHTVIEGDGFSMKPGYKNFQPVTEGEVLARDNQGEINASRDGLILMPLYQEQGEDGFFLIRPINL